MVSDSLEWFRKVWDGLRWFGMVWNGLGWFGMVWSTAKEKYFLGLSLPRLILYFSYPCQGKFLPRHILAKVCCIASLSRLNFSLSYSFQ